MTSKEKRQTMRRTTLASLAALAVALCLGQASPAVAAFGDFTYTSTLGPPVTNGSGNNSSITLLGITTPTALNAATFAAPGTDTPVGTITLADLTGGLPYNDNYNFGYTITVNLTDVDSGFSGVVKLTGTLSGSIASDGVTESSSLVTSLPVAQSITLGTTKYTLTAVLGKFFASPGAPSPLTPGNPGRFTLETFASPAVPEPSSIALTGIGVVGLLAIARRRRTARIEA